MTVLRHGSKIDGEELALISVIEYPTHPVYVNVHCEGLVAHRTMGRSEIDNTVCACASVQCACTACARVLCALCARAVRLCVCACVRVCR
jgi:hypothetical protein